MNAADCTGPCRPGELVVPNLTLALGQPLDILQPRTMRLAAQLRF